MVVDASSYQPFALSVYFRICRTFRVHEFCVIINK